MALIDQILLQGKDSRLYQALVQEKGYTDDVSGGINAELGNLFDINGPTLFQAYLFHDKSTPAAAILDTFDAEVEKLRAAPIDKATLDLAKVKARSWLTSRWRISSVSARRPARLLRAVRRRPGRSTPWRPSSTR